MTKPNDPERRLIPLQLDAIHAATWYPTPKPVGKPTQVHLFLDVDFPANSKDPKDKPLNVQFATRFKSAYALDKFIEMLLMHREDVWGKWQRDPTIREDLDQVDYSK